MKKYRLEDLKKTGFFTQPPDGYFDRLPGIIQAKTAGRSKSRARIYWSGALKLVPAAAALALILWYSGIFNSSEPMPSMEEILAEVSSEDIINYLEDLDLTNDEILEEVDFEELSLDFQGPQDQLFENLGIEDEVLMELYDNLDVDESLL